GEADELEFSGEPEGPVEERPADGVEHGIDEYGTNDQQGGRQQEVRREAPPQGRSPRPVVRRRRSPRLLRLDLLTDHADTNLTTLGATTEARQWGRRANARRPHTPSSEQLIDPLAGIVEPLL